MDNRSYSNKNDISKYEKNSHQSNREMNEKNDSSLLTIYSFISSYVLKEESNYDEIDNKYILLENKVLENENGMKKVNFSYYNEKIDDNYEDENEELEEEGYENEYNEEYKKEQIIEIKKKKKKKDLLIQKDCTYNNRETYEKKKKKKEKKKNYIYESEDSDEFYNNSNIKKKMKKLSKYFMLSIDNINEEENIFKNEKHLSKQMSYYNDAYYYTSEMIYKDNRKNKEKFALYLRLISLFINIIIGIYLIVHFPHTNNQLEIKFSNKYTREHEKLKDIIRNSMELKKDNNKHMMDMNLNSNLSINENEINKNRNTFLNILFRNNKEIDHINNNINNEKKDNNIYIIKETNFNKTNNAVTNADNYMHINENDINNLVKEIDIVNLIDDENIMNFIYSIMNKIYKYAIYSFFGELLVISIIVFSLFILKIFIKDNNKFSVILTMYGILYKIFCYFFAHYVLFMGIYILSIYYNIYIHKDIYENSFNFFCYHYVYNNLHIHLLMLFYAFQNIIFTINDAFNCIRMMFILIKHIIIKIYEKITCKSFITFYELKEDKSLLSVNCFNIMKKKCNAYSKCCKDKNCAEVDIDEVHDLEYNKSNIPFTNSNEKSYCRNLDIKTYEQSLLNMRNPIFK